MSEEIMNTPNESTQAKEKRVTKTPLAVSVGNRIYKDIELYCKSTGTSMTRLVESLIKEFLEKEEVKNVISENKVDKRKLRALETKKAKLAKLQAEIAELEKEQ